MSRTAIFVTVVLAAVLLLVGYMIVKAKSAPPARSGDRVPAPTGGTKPGNKYLGFASDLLGLGKQGVDIYNTWNSANKRPLNG